MGMVKKCHLYISGEIQGMVYEIVLPTLCCLLPGVIQKEAKDGPQTPQAAFRIELPSFQQFHCFREIYTCSQGCQVCKRFNC